MLNSNVWFKCWIQILDLNVELKCLIQMLDLNVKLKCWNHVCFDRIYWSFWSCFGLSWIIDTSYWNLCTITCTQYRYYERARIKTGKIEKTSLSLYIYYVIIQCYTSFCQNVPNKCVHYKPTRLKVASWLHFLLTDYKFQCLT